MQSIKPCVSIITMPFHKKTVGYVSDIDQCLTEFDKTHPLTESQQAEIKKYQRIAQLRDDPNAQKLEDEIWKGF